MALWFSATWEMGWDSQGVGSCGIELGCGSVIAGTLESFELSELGKVWGELSRAPGCGHWRGISPEKR